MARIVASPGLSARGKRVTFTYSAARAMNGVCKAAMIPEADITFTGFLKARTIITGMIPVTVAMKTRFNCILWSYCNPVL